MFLSARALLGAALFCPPSESGRGAAGCHPLQSVRQHSLLRCGAAERCWTPRLLLCCSKTSVLSAGWLVREVLLQRCYSCTHRAAEQPPAGVSSLLHCSSLAQCLGRTLLRAAGPPGYRWGIPGTPRPCCLWVFSAAGFGWEKCCLRWSVCRGRVRHQGGGDAPKVIEASRGSGSHLCCSRTDHSAKHPSASKAKCFSVMPYLPPWSWTSCRNADLARSPGTLPSLPW